MTSQMVGMHASLRLAFLYAQSLFRHEQDSAEVIARRRLRLLIRAFGLVFVAIALRLVVLGFLSDPSGVRAPVTDAIAAARPEIVDRNGELIAIDLRSPSLFAEPRRLIDPDEVLEGLLKVLPDLDMAEVRSRLNSKKGFAWLKREITPDQRRAIYRLGFPGIGFIDETRRVYPQGATFAHVLGNVNLDNRGVAGLEKYIDDKGLSDLHLAGLASDQQQEAVHLALDSRVQHAVRDELLKALATYRAKAAMGLVSNVRTGEIVAMVSLPDFDPNQGGDPRDLSHLNRLTTGVFEMGSTFKSLSFAMALDSGRITLASTFDARTPLSFGRFAIHDYHGENRILSLPEIFLASSNIGTAKMVLSLGVEAHRAFLKKMGQLDRLRTELPENAMPIVPKRWGDVNSATIAFGHGIAVAPLQAVMAVNSMVNGGYLIPPTLMQRSESEAMQVATRVLKPETSDKMRYLLRLNVERGSGKAANIVGFNVGAKTGTAEKVENGRYAHHKLLTSFTAVFPMERPAFLLLVMLDEPQGTPQTHGLAASGWNAAPTAGKIIARIAPLLDVAKREQPLAAEDILRRTNRAAAH